MRTLKELVFVIREVIKKHRAQNKIHPFDVDLLLEKVREEMTEEEYEFIKAEKTEHIKKRKEILMDYQRRNITEKMKCEALNKLGFFGHGKPNLPEGEEHLQVE